MFAIMILPILGFVGVAVDYSRVNDARTAMQSALDSAALMIAKDNAGSSLTSAQFTAKAQGYFTAMFDKHPEVTVSSFSATYNAAGPTVSLTASGSISAAFTKLIGFPTLSFNTASTTTWGVSKLRIALVLDNTTSMYDDNKFTEMKSAATTLVDQLSAKAQNPGDVYISIIPFAKDVNVGTNNVNQNWIDWTLWDAANQSCNGGGKSQTCGAKDHKTWTGCVTDRTQNYDTTNTPPTSAVTNFPAEQYVDDSGSDNCTPTSNGGLQPIMPLGTNWTAMKAEINAMQGALGTNQPIGLAWAWMSLLQGSPLNAPPLDPNSSYFQAIIILSDGLNTKDRWYGDPSYGWSPQVDDRQRILCDNIKASGLTIYAIQVNTDGEAQSAVLAYCASGADKFYYLTSSSQIQATFNSIIGSISKLRITK